MLANQLKTPNLLHPPELQFPLFWQPLGVPPPPLLQEEHPIVLNFGKITKINSEILIFQMT